MKISTDKTTKTSNSNTNKSQPSTPKSWRTKFNKGLFTASLLLSGTPCFAATGDSFPVTAVLSSILSEIQGPIIAIVTALGLIAAGVFYMLKGHEIGLKQALCALIGGAIAVGTPSLLLMIPGMQGAII